MGIFSGKLEDIWEGTAPFCGRTLYGNAAGPVRPDLPPRPFPPEEAEGRFQGLAREGVSFVRLVITWEALEYAGPGAYDESYLAYLRKILVAAAQTGLFVFIDPVQNRWSRWLDAEGFPPWAPEQRDKGREWLQERYLDCMRHCFRRLKNCAALIGWGAAAADLSVPFMLRFAARMREARAETRFFIAEAPPARDQGLRPFTGSGGDPGRAADAFYCYDGSAFPDY
jgi:hypothetical protein